jgi:hypothetical protein
VGCNCVCGPAFTEQSPVLQRPELQRPELQPVAPQVLQPELHEEQDPPQDVPQALQEEPQLLQALQELQAGPACQPNSPGL